MGCVRVCLSDVDVAKSPWRDELNFRVRITTDDNYLALNGVQIRPRKGRPLRIGGVLDLENSGLLLRHGLPFQQLLSSFKFATLDVVGLHNLTMTMISQMQSVYVTLITPIESNSSSIIFTKFSYSVLQIYDDDELDEKTTAA